MNKQWPFGFFVYSNLDDNETSAPAEEVVEMEVETEAEVAAPVEEPVKDEIVEEIVEEPVVEEPVVEEILPEASEVLVESVDVEDEDDDEEGKELEAEEDDDDADLPDLEEELEIALEEAHQEAVKQHRLIKGVTTGIAVLGAVGLATGLAIHSYFKRK